jgi:lipopolysaccharide export system permease protein
MKMHKAYIENEHYVSRFLHYTPLFPQMEHQRLIHKQTKYQPISDTNILNNFDANNRSVIRAVALSTARGMKGTLDGYSANQVFLTTDIALYRTEYHKKFAHSFLIFMLFLISAPLGAIIKKGGIGLPLVISVILFVLFYAINLTGEKMGKELVMPVWTGMWMSSMFLFPIGLWITFKAIRDSNAFTLGGFIPFIGKLLNQLFSLLKKKKA